MPALPDVHAAFLERIISAVQSDGRFQGLALGGSYVNDEMDEFSDLDCVLVLHQGMYSVPFLDGPRFAESLGDLTACFDGQHVNEPRLLVCLFDNPVLHVDLKFVDLDGFARNRWEEPAVVWERNDALTSALAQHALPDHQVDVQWIEGRFWVWVHYEASKIARGELLEAHGSAAWFARVVLGPLIYAGASRRADGVRRLEQRWPERAKELAATFPREHSAAGCLASLRARVALYLSLREPFVATLALRRGAQEAALQFLDELQA